MLPQRLRSSGRAIFRTVSPRIWGGDEGSAFKRLAFPNLKRKTSNTWSAVQDTYLSTKVATLFLNSGSLVSFFSVLVPVLIALLNQVSLYFPFGCQLNGGCLVMGYRLFNMWGWFFGSRINWLIKLEIAELALKFAFWITFSCAFLWKLCGNLAFFFGA